MPRMAEGCKALKPGFEHNGDYPQKFKRMGSDKVFGRYIQPMILPYYEEVQLESGKRVAAITIGQDVSKSYLVRHNDTETAYIRIGSVSRPAIREPNEFYDNLRRPQTVAVSGRGYPGGYETMPHPFPFRKILCLLQYRFL